MTSTRSAPPYNNSAMPALKHLNIGTAQAVSQSYTGPRAAGQANFLQMSGADSDSDSDSDSDVERPNLAPALSEVSQVRTLDQQYTTPAQQQKSTSVKIDAPEKLAEFAQESAPAQQDAPIEQSVPNPAFLAPAVREAATSQPEQPSLAPAVRETITTQPEQVSVSETLPKTTSVTTVRRVNLNEGNTGRSESPLPNPHSQSQNGTLFDVWNRNSLDLDQSSSKSKHSSWRKSDAMPSKVMAPKGSDGDSQRSDPTSMLERSPSPTYDNEPARKATSKFRPPVSLNPFGASHERNQYESNRDQQTFENGPSKDYAEYQEQVQEPREYQEEYPQYAQEPNTQSEAYQQYDYEQAGYPEEYQQYPQEYQGEHHEHQDYNEDAQQYQHEQADYHMQEPPTESNVLHYESYQLDAGRYQSQDLNLLPAERNAEQNWNLSDMGDNQYNPQYEDYDQTAWDSRNPEQYTYEQPHQQHEAANDDQQGEETADSAYNQQDHHPTLEGDEFFVIDDGAAALMSDPRRNVNSSEFVDEFPNPVRQESATERSRDATPLKSTSKSDIQKGSGSPTEVNQNSDGYVHSEDKHGTRRLSSDETQSAAMLPPSQAASQSTPDKSLKNTASRFFRKVISPKPQRKSETASTPTRRPERFTEQFGERPADSAFASDQQRNVGRISEESTTSSVLDLAGGVDLNASPQAVNTDATPTKEIGSPSPKTKSNLRQRLRNKYNFFPSRTSSETTAANTEDEVRGLRSYDKLPKSNITRVKNASAEQAASSGPGAVSRDTPSRPSLTGSDSQTYGLPREPSPYYTSDHLFDRPGEAPSNRRSDRSGHRGNPLQAFFKRFGGHSSATQTSKKKPTSASQAQEEPVPFQHELRRRESVIRAHRRSRSVGGFDVQGLSLDAGHPDAAESESWQRDERLSKPSSTDDARRTKYLSVNSTSASNRDSFATAHSNQDPLAQDTLAPPRTGSTPTSSGRNSQRFSQSNDSRLSDSHSLFSHTSQSTHPTSAAQSNTDLSKPMSGRDRLGQSNASSKRQSTQGFQPSNLPSVVSEVPSPKLGVMHDENERDSILPGSTRSTADPTSSKRLSLGLNDDSWLLDLDFDRATSDKSAVNHLGSSFNADYPQGFSTATGGSRTQTRAVPNNRISDEEPLSLDLPDALNFSPVLVNYL